MPRPISYCFGGPSKKGCIFKESMGKTGGGCTGLKGLSRDKESCKACCASAKSKESTCFSALASKLSRQLSIFFFVKSSTLSLTFSAMNFCLSLAQASAPKHSNMKRKLWQQCFKTSREIRKTIGSIIWTDKGVLANLNIFPGVKVLLKQ